MKQSIISKLKPSQPNIAGDRLNDEPAPNNEGLFNQAAKLVTSSTPWRRMFFPPAAQAKAVEVSETLKDIAYLKAIYHKDSESIGDASKYRLNQEQRNKEIKNAIERLNNNPETKPSLWLKNILK